MKYLSVLPVVAVLVFSGVSLAHADVFTENLYYGLQNNSQVSQLQEFLTTENLYTGPVTGNFYFLTLAAVKSFQNQQGITPDAGYFGPKTRTAANVIADAEVGASNAEAISETGTSTPPVQAPGQSSSTPQLQLTALLQEVALLQQELTAQQSSTQALSNLQTQAQTQTQTLQQIAANTTPSSCPTEVMAASQIPAGCPTDIDILDQQPIQPAPQPTTGPSVTVAPVITNVANQNLTDSSAVITWMTNAESNSVIYLGTSPGAYFTSLDGTTEPYEGSYTHAVSLPNLQANTTYYYVVASTGTGGNEGVGNASSFTTSPSPPPPPPPTGSLSASQNTALGTQSFTAGATDQEIGSYALTASSAERVSVSNISITVNAGTPTLLNLKLIVNGAQFGTTQPTAGPAMYTFSGSSFNVPAVGTVDVNVYADIGPSATGSSSGGATSLTGLSGTGTTSNDSVALNSVVAGQNIAILTGSSITVTANQGGNPSVGQISMDTTGNTLAAFNFQETENKESIKVTQLNIVDVTNAANPSFSALTLWNGATQVDGQANYIGATTVNGQSAFLYQFQFGNSSPFVIPRNGTLYVNLKGNVNAYTAGNVTDGSIHTFEIAPSAADPTATSTVVAMGQISDLPANVVLSNPVGTAQTILQNGMVFSAAMLGPTSNRVKSTGDQLATLTFTPGNGGSLALNTLVLTFSGSAISSNGSQATAFANSMYLLLNGTQYPVASTACTGPSACTATWNFGSGINGFQVNGSPVTGNAR